MLREIFQSINKLNTPYKNIYYLTDTELRFSINDDRVGRIVTYSIRKENDKYVAYAFEKSQITSLSTTNRQRIKEVNTDEEFWKFHSDFYNDINN